MHRFPARLLLVVCLAVVVVGCGGETGSTNSEPPAALIVSTDEWVFENSSLWTYDEGVLEQISPGLPVEGIRRPFAVAHLAGTEDVADFHLTAEIKSTTSPEVVGRDVIVVFGYRSPSKFYYAHLSNDNTVMAHNGIFVVNHADRLRIDEQGLDNPPPARLNDTEWHEIRVDRNVSTGRIEVYMDDLRTPLMTATDKTFDSGAVGFGTFNDTGAIRRVHLENGSAPLVDPISKRIETGTLTLGLDSFAVIPPSDTSGGPMARINYLSDAGDGTKRLFVNDLRGKMYLIDEGEVTEYLDLSSQAPDFVDSPGLGSGFGFFVFHPDFAQNGKLYTIHTEAGEALVTRTPDYSHQAGDVIQGVLLEWTTTEPEHSTFKGSSREVLRMGFPSQLHGMQQMGFDPRAQPGDEDFGLLYISVGDGERPNAQTNNPQSLSAHTGKIFRIDPLGSDSPNGQYGIPSANPFVSQKDALGEIWALGLRNPHRFSWDSSTGAMFIGHIGEQQVDSIFPGLEGANYGWNLREGGFRFEKENPLKVYALSAANQAHGYTNPVARLDHDELRAIVGGFVYRGSRLPALYGKYLFGDIVSGRVFYTLASEMAGGDMDAEIREVVLLDSEGARRSFEHFAQRPRADLRFGMDAEGEIYLLSKANGSIWMISSASDPGSKNEIRP